MHIHQPKIKQRVVIKENRTEGILNYDIDNAYPQRMLSALAHSGIASTCVDWYRRFILGQGFTDEIFGRSTINADGLTPNLLLRLVVKDFARLNGFAIHVNYNMNGAISNVNWMPWTRTRLTKPDDQDLVGKIAVHKDWARERSLLIRKTDIEFINTFNDDPEIVMAQIESAKGIDRYRGQILWFSPEGMNYPLVRFDPVLEDVQTDAGIKVSKNSAVLKGFKANRIFIYKGKFENDQDREDFLDEMEEFDGPENLNSSMLVEVDRKEEIPEIIQIEAPKSDKLFELTERTVQENIRMIYHVPEVFIKSTPGKLGQDGQLEQAEVFYNKDTEDERLIFNEQFKRLFANFMRPINPTGDFSIIPFTFAS